MHKEKSISVCQFESPSLNSKHICDGNVTNRENHFSSLFLLTNCSVLREEVFCNKGPLPHRNVGCIFRDPHFLVLVCFPNWLLGCKVRLQPIDFHLYLGLAISVEKVKRFLFPGPIFFPYDFPKRCTESVLSSGIIVPVMSAVKRTCIWTSVWDIVGTDYSGTKRAHMYTQDFQIHGDGSDLAARHLEILDIWPDFKFNLNKLSRGKKWRFVREAEICNTCFVTASP